MPLDLSFHATGRADTLRAPARAARTPGPSPQLVLIDRLAGEDLSPICRQLSGDVLLLGQNAAVGAEQVMDAHGLGLPGEPAELPRHLVLSVKA